MIEANQGADLNKPYFTGGQMEVWRILRIDARVPVSRWGSFSMNLWDLLSSSNAHEFQTLPINGPKRAGPGPFLLAFPGHAAPSYPLPAGFPAGSIRRLHTGCRGSSDSRSGFCPSPLRSNLGESQRRKRCVALASRRPSLSPGWPGS